MKTEFLKGLGLEQDAVDKVMAEHGKALNALKSEVETLKTSESGLKEQLKLRDKDIADLKKGAGDSEKLKGDLDALQAKYKADTKALEGRVTDAQMSAAIKVAIAATAHDPEIVAAQIDKSKIALNDDGSVKMGLDEQVKQLMKDKAFLFKAEGGKPSGGEPGPSGDPDEPGDGPTEAALNAAFGIAAPAQ
jgi:SMC interacting uncharacterized protein involved in chromosome segregation